jgi:hypothetical protein
MIDNQLHPFHMKGSVWGRITYAIEPSFLLMRYYMMQMMITLSHTDISLRQLLTSRLCFKFDKRFYYKRRRICTGNKDGHRV